MKLERLLHIPKIHQAIQCLLQLLAGGVHANLAHSTSRSVESHCNCSPVADLHPLVLPRVSKNASSSPAYGCDAGHYPVPHLPHLLQHHFCIPGVLGKIRLCRVV